MDYKSMEVKMLGWLSGDDEINGLCDSEDIYRVAYEKILKTPCDSEDKRSLMVPYCRFLIVKREELDKL
jgi:hypothetical protein